ncbi:MAG: hypothetical protein EBZ50_12790 [Alphaproteobacteria bacterium]|nr:hypothetical protein [Alphaproteobacteria bacterium]
MSIFRFEHRSKPVASRAVFAGRLIYNLVFALFIVAIALAAGMVGYRITEQMRWLDSFLNAAMLLGGMGPVDVLKSDAGKLFAGVYALFCGLIIVLTTGIVLAPALHRILHSMHAESTPD